MTEHWATTCEFDDSQSQLSDWREREKRKRGVHLVGTSAYDPELLILRAFDPTTDTSSLLAIDNSVSCDSRYEVATDNDSLVLQKRPLSSPRLKHFDINLDDPVCSDAIVAVYDGMVRGFVATNYETWNRRLAIWHFYVDVSFRRRSIGPKLLNAAIENGRGVGAQTAWVETSNFNVAGVATYQRLGFELCGFDTSLYRGTQSEGEFALFLSRSIASQISNVVI